MKRGQKFVFDRLPVAHDMFIHKRVLPLVQHYGHCIAGMDIMTLAKSCYHQAISDMSQLRPSTQEPDYQI